MAGELAPAKKPKKSKAAKAGKPEPKEPPTSSGQAPKEGAPAAVNMLGWQGLGLGSRVVAAIATLGFEEPTPIQRECMQPAIRDRRDIIGAAQTVGPLSRCIMQWQSPQSQGGCTG